MQPGSKDRLRANKRGMPAIIRSLGNRKFSMVKFITHEAVAAGTFGRSYSPPNAGVWQEALCNSQPEVLDWYLLRLEKDFEDLHVKQRKPWTGKDLVPWFQINLASMVLLVFRL